MGEAGFVLDLGRCLGCSACVLACRLENADRSSLPLRRVLPLNEARRSAGPTWFLSVACHHCERPACLRACPSGAYQRGADGVVTHEAALCVGCRYCEMACPFGAPQFEAATGIMAKCDFCQARVTQGDAPACIAACPTEALRMASPRTGSGLNSPITELHDASVTGELSPDPTLPAEPGVGGADDANVVRLIPGFVDAAACRPAIRFKLPRGIRGRRLQQLMAPRAGPQVHQADLVEQDPRPTRVERPAFGQFHEWPLVVFTALAIPAAGVFAARLLAGLVSGAAMPRDGADALAAMALFAGLASSLAHLGRPLRAPLALRRSGRNALSTEVALASALLILALLARVPSLSLALRLAFVRASGVVAFGLLAALGLVYFLPARWPWRTLLVATPMTSGLAIGMLVLACGAAPSFPLVGPFAMLVVDAVIVCAACQLHLPHAPPHALAPVHPRIFARRRPLVALRVLLVDLIPAALLLAHMPMPGWGIAVAGVFVDRFAFYGLAAVRSTEAAIAELERVIARR